MTETTNLFPDSAEPTSTGEPAKPGAAGASPEPGAAGTSAGQTSAVRSWPGSSAADDARGKGGTGRLPAMLLPELQRLGQSLGITGIGRMRKGQLIAAIDLGLFTKVSEGSETIPAIAEALDISPLNAERLAVAHW